VTTLLSGSAPYRPHRTFASRRRNEAELGKMGSERIDQLRALTD
jgi:hypothetical protein